MRLIIKYTVTDECTYWTEVIVPVEYDSVEQFLNDFDDLVNLNKDSLSNFTLGGYEFVTFDFVRRYYNDEGKFIKTTVSLPEVMTVDEWFNSYK